MNLKPIWDATYSIYREMDTICKRHGLKMYVAYGTALGAVRHGGFIPWDDDFDVNMPRKDYEMFLKIALHELPSWLTVVSYRNCLSYRNLFPKVIISDENRLLEICEASGLSAPQGVFVDVFPIDGYPDSWFGKRLRIVTMGITRFLLKHSHSGRPNALMEWFSVFFDYAKSKKVIDWCGWYGQELNFLKRDNKTWPSASTFAEGRVVPFMDGEVIVPSDVDCYLRWVYGDYMDLPPDDQRHPSHTVGGRMVSWRLGPPKKVR